MKILIICSKSFYYSIPKIQTLLEQEGHTVYLPNCYEHPETENQMKALGSQEHAAFKAAMFQKSEKVIAQMNAVLVLNYLKNTIKGYIGGATFLEMYDAFRLGKKIYLYNDIPEGILSDEIAGFSPIILHGEVKKIK